MIIFLNEKYSGTIKAFHGSDVKITNFSYDYVGGKEANDEHGSGFYFFTDEKYMFTYGKYAHQCTLHLNNVIERGGKPNLKNMTKLANALPSSIKRDVGVDWDENWKVGFRDFILSSYNSAVDEYDGYLNIWIDGYRNIHNLWVENMSKILNIDAHDTGEGIIVVFNKDSINIDKIYKNKE